MYNKRNNNNIRTEQWNRRTVPFSPAAAADNVGDGCRRIVPYGRYVRTLYRYVHISLIRLEFSSAIRSTAIDLYNMCVMYLCIGREKNRRLSHALAYGTFLFHYILQRILLLCVYGFYFTTISSFGFPPHTSASLLVKDSYISSV